MKISNQIAHRSFPSVACKRNVIFFIFELSQHWDGPFFRFLLNPRPRKARFFNFYSIRGLGKPIFPIFTQSETSESPFFQFLLNPRPRKAHFFNFYSIRDLGKLVFPIFTQSETSESPFFQFLLNTRPRLANQFIFRRLTEQYTAGNHIISACTKLKQCMCS